MTFSIRNWKKFQHFRDRRPPWIKLYRDILDDPDWHDLSGDEAKALVMLWLIASEDDGRLPDARKLAFRLRVSTKRIDQLLIRLEHWVGQNDIDPASAGYQDDAPEREGETETEGETQEQGETEVRAVAVATRPSVDEFFERFWAVYPKRGTAANPKKPARDKFERAVRDGADPEILIAAAKRFSEVERSDGRFGTEKVAQAITWLNQQRWNDYPVAVAANSTGPPQPPQPGMPTDAELRAKYAKIQAERAGPGLVEVRESENAGVFPEGPDAHPGNGRSIRH